MPKNITPKFGIFIDYVTGDSFHTENIYGEEFGPAWTDINKAYAALANLKEHAKLHEDFERDSAFNPRSRYQAKNLAIKSDWHKKAASVRKINTNDDFDLFYNFGLEKDDGTIAIFTPPYIGYFEQYIDARVELIQPD